LESVGASWSAVSAEESGACAENGGAATAQKNHGAAPACSKVASGAALTEIFEAAAEAIAAIEDGDFEIAKARLQAILALAQGPAETTGCAAPVER
jgi:hypothetical protein